MRLYAPAKINWTLEVLGRREDGYHEVRTLMQAVEPCDTVDIEQATELSLETEGRHEPSEDDLALRAARLLDGGRGAGARIRLTKRIPVAAGLGGGSSDAAAALRGLNALWGLGHDEASLMGIASQVGSDVAFFVRGGAALVAGRGERVAPLPDIDPVWLVLVVPPLTLPQKTKRMYGSLLPGDFSDGSRTDTLAQWTQDGTPPGDRDLCNAFERAAYDVFEGLAACRESLLVAGARRVHLAGAGPALFALGPDEQAARALHERLRPPGGAAMVVRTLTSAEALRVEG